MAVKDFSTPAKVTIKNIIDPSANPVINGQALTGVRQFMTKAEAEAAGYTVWEYLLDNKGNFVVEEEATEETVKVAAAAEGDGTTQTPTTTTPTTPVAKAIDTDNIMVVVRQSVKETDRMIQLYRVQQTILLTAGDSVVLTANTPGAAAHYASLAVEGEIEVTVESATADETKKS